MDLAVRSAAGTSRRFVAPRIIPFVGRSVLLGLFFVLLAWCVRKASGAHRNLVWRGLFVALLAVWLPARQASRVEPAIALRTE